ncbi:MAG: SpoIIE family protein phosphatase [Chloroflexi bacterium]|nr:SpoIIE family protein phosphatase [Chloroflexota bacterium]
MPSQAAGNADHVVTVTIPNYQLIRVLGEGRHAVVYEAYRQHDPDRQPFTLKVFKDIYPSPAQQARFQHELRVMQRLDSPYLVKVISLEEQAGIFMLISHYDELRSLRDWLAQTPFSVELFLKVAIQLARALADIHQQGVMHGDLKPSNILVDANADTIKLADFGMSRIFERQFAYYPESIQGTLPYISPEQTGRTNKLVDYRSDFYSLGVTLFQMATGRLPFEAKDHLSLIHAHLAVEPPRAAALNPALPQPLSDIIARLMAKNPEDRYQGATIRTDLEHCQAEWLASRTIAPFPLGSADRRLHFEVSRKLYGREAELQHLIEFLNQMGQGPPTLTLVAGSAGIGKSSLIQALQPAILAIRGMFIANKYDQYQRNIPYSALMRSLQTLIRRLLREPAAALQVWQEVMQAAVDVKGRVISEVIPELELLLGPQAPVPILPPAQAKERFISTFNQFLRACGSTHQPLILFLDDLQWADESSLDFLQAFLADPQPAHIFIIGAYRDVEVSPDHRLKRLISHLSAIGRPPYQVNLTPLDLAAVKDLLADTLLHQRPSINGQLQQSADTTADASLELLANLLYQKSGGNPFFVTTLLQTLHNDSLLTPTSAHDGEKSGLDWQWDLAAIQNARLSDNIIDLLLQKLERLPEETLHLLEQAACLGNSFQLAILNLVSQLDFETLYAHLEPAIQADLIRQRDDTISFVHDRVQEAIYQQLDEAERQQHHWQIGQIMLNHYNQQTLDEQLFTVVNQLNQGRALTEDPAICIRLLELNYQAGLKARNNIAFDASLAYLQVTAELLPPDNWQTNYSQTYTVWYELMMANMLLYKREASLATADVILTNAGSDLDRARCYRRLALLHGWQGDFNQAIAVGNQALSLFGQALPEDKQLIRQAIGNELKHLAAHLTSKEAILNLPEMTDPLALVQLEIRHELTPTLYRTSTELLVLNNLQMIRLALEYGSHPALSVAFVGSAVAMIVQQQLKQAVLFNAIATALWERYPTAFETAQNVIAAAWSSPVLLPDLAAIRRQNQWGQTLCKNVSNIFYWGASITIQTLTELIDGQDLVKTLAEAQEAHSQFFQRFQVERYHQLLVAIIEGYLKPLSGSEAVDLTTLEQNAQTTQLFYIAFHLRIFAGMLSYTFGDYVTAFEHLTKVKEYAASQPAGLINPVWQIYQALTLLALAQETPDNAAVPANDEGPGTVEQAEELLSKVEALNEHSDIFKPYTAFVRAELAYTQRDPHWHSAFFAAIDQATMAEYILLQAIIHERLAKHMLASGYRSSRGHLEESLYLFEQCGAAAKVQQLKQVYAFYLRPPSGRDQPSASISSSVSGDTPASDSSQTLPALHRDLDIYAIFKASQAISSEIELERVLSVIMQTLGEVSGAESAYLIMEQAGERLIKARYQARTGQIVARLGEAILVRGSNLLSEGVVRYVHRTRETLLLDDAAAVGEFTNDHYIQAHQVRSVLCQPIQEQNRLIGSVYLENNLSSQAFTPERAEVLRLLAAQAAISLTNAQAIVARAEQERTQHELQIARDVQLSLLPQEIPYIPHFDIAHTSLAARHVSGDLYGYFQRPNGSLAVAVGDVTGKGMAAALLMSATVVALAGAVEADLSPAETLTRIDRVLQPFIASKQNVGICLAYLDHGQMCVANAGAIAPIVRNKEGTRMLLEVGGLPLGTHLSGLFPYENTTLQLSPNDLVILTTDGLVEAHNASRQMYGFDRFETAIAAGPSDSAQAMLDYLLADWRSFVGQVEQLDDLTVVVVRVSA